MEARPHLPGGTPERRSTCARALPDMVQWHAGMGRCGVWRGEHVYQEAHLNVAAHASKRYQIWYSGVRGVRGRIPPPPSFARAPPSAQLQQPS
eukprot:224171-Chlamydomonas_euryale.AAC.1